MRKQGYFGSNPLLSAVSKYRKSQLTGLTLPSLDTDLIDQARDLLNGLKKKSPKELEKYERRLTNQEKREIEILSYCVAFEDSANSIEYFAQYVRTKDEHGDGSTSIKHFPARSEKPYLWEFLDACVEEDLVAVEKSRQLMLTWGACLFCLWYAKFRPNQLVLVQSKKEEDAANLVYNKEPPHGRISFMEYNLPPEMQTMDWKKGTSYSQLAFANGSRIWGIPEGGDKVRSYTASVWFSDEFAFQPEAEDAWKAARPTVSGGGKVILISTARAGAFMQKLIA